MTVLSEEEVVIREWKMESGTWRVESGKHIHSANGKQPMAIIFVHSYFIRAFVAYF